MAENKSRFVLVCQQAFAFARSARCRPSPPPVSSSSDIVAPADAQAAAGHRHRSPPAHRVVSSAPVKSHVRTVPLGGAASGAA